MILGAIVPGLVGLAGVAVAADALYLLTLASASAFYRARPARATPRCRLVVLVPAHNEAELIARCIASLRDQTYARDRYRIVVVADNCNDETAAVAAAAGAEVMVRNIPAIRGKGRALRWAMDRILADATPPDAIVVIDADSVADPDFLRQLAVEFEAGSELVQANDLVLVEPGLGRSALEAAALLLRNGVRFAGRAALGLPAVLCGNGMLLSRQVLRDHPWDAFTATEDGEYSLMLRVAGITVRFAQGARIYAEATSNEAGAYTQGVRWEAGRFYLMRRWLPRMLAAMVGRRRWELAGDAVDLAVPPFGIVLVAALLGLTGSLILTILHAIPAIVLAPWALAVMVLPAYIVIGLRAAHAPADYYRSLLVLGPLFIARKLRIYRRLLKGYEMTQWVRTARPAESRGR